MNLVPISKNIFFSILLASLSVPSSEASKEATNTSYNCIITLHLKEDEVAIFAYGSLMLASELHHQPYSGPFIQAKLSGFKRSWSASYPNERKYSFSDANGDTFIPETFTYLNVEPSPGSEVNGMIFVCSKSALKFYDKRESIYDRVKINDYLKGVSITGGDAYVYTAKPNHLVPTENLTPYQTVIPRYYIQTIKKALSILGNDFFKDFINSTQPLPLPLVFE